jgi:hypothetical protein
MQLRSGERQVGNRNIRGIVREVNQISALVELAEISLRIGQRRRITPPFRSVGDDRLPLSRTLDRDTGLQFKRPL